MAFNPHTAEDRSEMLAVIGIDDVSELFEPIPAGVRRPRLDLPPRLTEMEAAAYLDDLAAKNLVPNGADSFLGAGSYRHYSPAAVSQLLLRGELFTAYTPYQPEVAQGTLQIIYEFQSLIAALFEMDVANASMYDGATALAEAVHMSIAASRKKNKVVISGTIHPNYLDVIETYSAGATFEMTTLPIPPQGLATTADDLLAAIDEDTAAVVVQYPNFFGTIEDLAAISDAVHAAGAYLIVATYPVPLSLLKPPGAYGADFVTAEGQSLGVAQSFGGPYVGLLATRQEFVRQLPGRLVGMTTDSEGKRGYVLALQTREQHIRREKATSNICTNQGLMATAATIYMSLIGPEGFREVGRASFDNAHYLAEQLATIPGVEIANGGEFFNEFTVRTPVTAAAINGALLEAGIIGGYDLANVDNSLANSLLVATTELTTRAGIDRFVEVVRSAVA
ncbi:MAG: aminomethyl-transferring glycine dehydrogenase subunit GcvPA [Thermomicrobiales bacterium]|nr:aminomethyl-transferring glycine dehydrogenase subunit GcvPA [Thermomicrobiales bacterium]